MSRIEILIVDDHLVVIEGLKSVLQEHVECEIVNEATDGLQAVELVKCLRPDIVIMDISMPVLNGIEATRKIKQFAPEIDIIIFTMYSEKEFIVDLFRAGISAYVLKDDPVSDLILAIEAVKSGGTYFSTMAPTVLLRYMEELEEKTMSEGSYHSLSQREQEVFRHLADGKRIKEIADELFISPKTVESHKYHIMEKLHANSVVDLAKMAIRENLIEA